MNLQFEQVEGLNIRLHGVDVAVIVHYAGGTNILSYNPAYIAMPKHLRPVMTLRQTQDPNYFDKPLIRSEKVPPVS